MRYWLVIGLCIVYGTAFPQNDSVQNVFAFKALSGKVYAHTNAVRNIKGAKPYGVEMEFAKQQTAPNHFSQAGAYVKSGWALAYVNFNNPILGYGMIASRFIEPQYSISNHLQFLIRASIGIDYLSNPNDAVKNPTNNNYSLHINPYLHIGCGIQYIVSKHAALALTGSLHHISNGNLMQPNKGLNWFTGAVSFNYYPGNSYLPRHKAMQGNKPTHQKPMIELGIFAVPRQGYYTKYAAQRNCIIGTTAQVSQQIGYTHAITAGTEIYYDDFNVDKTLQPISSKLVVGVQAGHVFLLGKVNFSQQIGYNVYNKIYFLPNFYTRWGIGYQLNRHYTLGANLKANSDNADFFDLRVTYKL